MRSIFYVLLILLFSCESANNHNKTTNESPMNEKSKPRVTGIGGIFFKCDNPENTRKWYKQNLNLIVNEYGSMLETRSIDNKISYLQWSPFSSKTTYFEPSEKDFMINYRVYDLEGLFNLLKYNGVTILDTIEKYEYGSFLHILDNENNKIELWEPIDVVFTNLYSGQTTLSPTVSSIQFRSNNPEKLCNWYKENLGFDIKSNESFFKYLVADDDEKIENLLWQPIPESSHIMKSEQQIIIGYKVDNLDSTMSVIKENDPKAIHSDKIKGESIILSDNDKQQIILTDRD